MTRTNVKILYFLLTLLGAIILTSCNTGYKVDNDKVYYTYWNAGMGIETKRFLIRSADAETFKVLNKENYAIDKNQAYYKGKPILNSDPKTFVSVLDYYAKDNIRAYKGAEIIDKADGKSFKVIDRGPYSKDNKDYYFDTTALNVNDINSFRILNKMDKYRYWAKDKTHYYILTMKYPLADYESFISIGNGYAKDKLRVYFEGYVATGADPSTFKSTEYGYGEDQYTKFDEHKKLNIQDLKSFEVLNFSFTKDKFHVYLNDSIIDKADPSTFETINWIWSKDKNLYFYHGKPILYIDYSTFRYLGYNYAIDKNNVYYAEKVLHGADAKTFKHIEGSQDGKDKNSCYRYGEKVDCYTLLEDE